MVGEMKRALLDIYDVQGMGELRAIRVWLTLNV